MTPTAMNRFKKLALSLAIILVINVFFNVGLDTFYPAPAYENFCSNEQMGKVYDTAETCEAADGIWNQGSTKEAVGYCDLYTKCSEAYNEAMQPYNRNAFVVLTTLGVAILLAGILVPSLPMAVANGLLYGGVLSILIGTMRYWSLMDDYLRFIVSGVALFLLVLVGIKRLKD